MCMLEGRQGSLEMEFPIREYNALLKFSRFDFFPFSIKNESIRFIFYVKVSQYRIDEKQVQEMRVDIFCIEVRSN